MIITIPRSSGGLAWIRLQCPPVAVMTPRQANFFAMSVSILAVRWALGAE
jgi:hypothetical protein